MKYLNNSTRKLIFRNEKGEEVVWDAQTVYDFAKNPEEIFGHISGMECLDNKEYKQAETKKSVVNEKEKKAVVNKKQDLVLDENDPIFNQ